MTGPIRAPSSANRARSAGVYERAAFRIARRRRMALLMPLLLASMWGTVNVIAGREERLTGAGTMHQALDGTLVMAWTALLVIVPFAAALKPKPIRAGALAALLLGPALTPLVFGHGWSLLPALAMTGLTVAALLPRRSL